MTTTRTITDPEQWTIGDHATVTHRDGAVTTGKLYEEYGYLFVGGTVVRYGSGNYSHLDVVVSRDVEEIAEPHGFGALVELGDGGFAARAHMYAGDPNSWLVHAGGWSSWRGLVRNYGVTRVVFEGVDL